MKPLQMNFAMSETDKSICGGVFRELENGQIEISIADGENLLANEEV